MKKLFLGIVLLLSAPSLVLSDAGVLLPRNQATTPRRIPSATCSGQLPNRLTFCMKDLNASFGWVAM